MDTYTSTRVSRFLAFPLIFLAATQLPADSPRTTITLTPNNARVPIGSTLQFRATVANAANPGVRWIINDTPGGNSSIGTVDATGLYRAPAQMPPNPSVLVKAISMADPNAVAFALVVFQKAAESQKTKVTVTPERSSVRVGGMQQFAAKVEGSANQQVKWLVNDVEGGNASTGTISPAGLYTAPPKKPTPAMVRVKAISVADPAASDQAAVSVEALKVTVSPDRPSVYLGGQQQFNARVEGSTNQQVKWYINDIPGGNMTLGLISDTGLYTTPAKQPSPATLRIKAVSVADPEAMDTTPLTVQNLRVSVTPERASIKPGEKQQFAARVTGSTNQQVKWYVHDIAGGDAMFGTISATGLYTAPDKAPSPAAFRVKAISVVDPEAMDSSAVTFQAAVTIKINVTPNTATVALGATQQFKAEVQNTSNTGVKWVVNDIPGGNDMVGMIDAAGLFKAPAKLPSPSVVQVKAISMADPQVSDTSAVTLRAATMTKVTVSPKTASVGVGATQQFSVKVENISVQQVNWLVNDVAGGSTALGKIDASGLYTAPATVPSPAMITIKAVSVGDPTASDTAAVTIQAAVSIKVTVAPATASVNTGATQMFKATVENSTNADVKWFVNDVAGGDATNGTISAAGLFTAPAKVPTNPAVTVKAVSAADTSASGTAAVTVKAAPVITLVVAPDQSTVPPGQTQLFKATLTNTTNTTVTWTVNDIAGGNAALGTISAAGLYTAPATVPNPATVTVKAVSAADSTVSDTSTITIQNATTSDFTITPPAIRPGPFTVTVRGTGFVAGTKATFAGANATVTFVSATEIQVAGTTPAGRLGDMVLVVSNPAPAASSRPLLLEVRSYTGDPKVSLADAHRILRQATFGPTPESVDRLQAIGSDAWLAEQLAGAQPGAYPTTLDAEGGLEPLQEHFMRLSVTWPDQLKLKVAWILSQIFVVSGVEVSRSEAMVSYQRMLYDNALGNFATILRNVTLHPAMGEYLDNVNNGKADPAQGIVPNENFGREVMQLLTVGVNKLMLNGTLAPSGVAVPTYDQSVVAGLTRALTGWTYNDGKAGSPTSWQRENYTGLMEPVERYHDTGEKILMDGFRIAPGQTAEQDLTSAHNHLFTHPNVGPYIVRQLIQHLVTSNPTPDYIARAAARFNDNGAGVRGDMKAVLRTILTDIEAAPPTAASFGKMREPVAFMAAQLRPLHPTVTDYPYTTDFAVEMSQNIFFSPSVFNYYSPNFRPAGSALYGPEFQLFNTATALIRANFTGDFISERFGDSLRADLTPYIHGAGDPAFLIDLVDRNIMGQQLSPAMKTAMADAVAQVTNNNKARAQLALYLAFTSSQFQVEH